MDQITCFDQPAIYKRNTEYGMIIKEGTSCQEAPSFKNSTSKKLFSHNHFSGNYSLFGFHLKEIYSII